MAERLYERTTQPVTSKPSPLTSQYQKKPSPAVIASAALATPSLASAIVADFVFRTALSVMASSSGGVSSNTEMKLRAAVE
jgi:hypothetical protein